MARPTQATTPTQIDSESRFLPPIVGLLPAAIPLGPIVVYCTAEALALGLCAYTLCTSTLSGKPVTLRCPTTGSGNAFCAIIIIQKVVYQYCLPVLKTVADILVEIELWWADMMDKALAELNAAIAACLSDTLCVELAIAAYNELVRSLERSKRLLQDNAKRGTNGQGGGTSPAGGYRGPLGNPLYL